MREQILKTLLQAKETYATLTNEYGNVLPANIMNGAHASIDSDIPRFANNFIGVLNSVEQQNLYSETNTFDEAIALFSNPDLDASIEKAINSKTYVATDGSRTFDAKEILEQCVYGVNTGADTLGLTMAAGRLSSGNR